jgi:hypothetical protein
VVANACSAMGWKFLRSNSVKPERGVMNDLLVDYQKDSRAYVLNPQYASPTSLPLYYYIGYQILQESQESQESPSLMDNGGNVCKRITFLCIDNVLTFNVY